MAKNEVMSRIFFFNLNLQYLCKHGYMLKLVDGLLDADMRKM